MSATTAPSATRLASLDVLRGIACALMAIDHVRVYSGLPAGGPTAGIFLTRWVTHFVAPVFCFLAGAGIWFLARRLANPGAVRRFLVTRGLLLVVLELTLIRFLWAFHVGFDFRLAGVVWMLGWCMVLLALFVGMRPSVVGWAGVAIVAFQPIFGVVAGVLSPALKPWWAFLYGPSGSAALHFSILYVIVPWVGVMMAGFGFGRLLERREPERTRLLHRLGLAMIALFLVIAIARVMTGDASSGDGPTRALWMRILDQRKYPASAAFLLMTLGPLVALVPWAERAKGALWRVMELFGRVPMWFYLMHLLVIHTSAVAVTWIRSGGPHWEWFKTAPYNRIPADERWSIVLLYLVWVFCLAALYPLCRWYEERKRTAPSPWMRYI